MEEASENDNGKNEECKNKREAYDWIGVRDSKEAPPKSVDHIENGIDARYGLPGGGKHFN